MRRIKLTKGYYTIVDEAWYEMLVLIKWHAIPNERSAYAHNCSYCNGGNKSTALHRLIMGVTDSKTNVDHINGDTLDNRVCNLRICTHKENSRNKHKRKPGSSRFKGVCWKIPNNRWVARIRVDDKLINIGSFENELDAAAAYDAEAIKFFGEFANINFKK